LKLAIKIEMLRAFSTVAQTGNLSEAAQRLGRTPSAVSMVLKSLEDHLGQRLFESDRKNRLTPLGTQVLELAQEELKQFDGTIRAIETFAQAPQGLVRAAAVPSVAALIFPAVLARFQQEFPSIRVELRDADSASVATALSRGQVDIGIASVPHGLGDTDQDLLFSDPFGLISSRDHLLATQIQDPDMQQIANSGFISNDLCRNLGGGEQLQLLQDAPALAQNTLTLMGMVKSGNWVTILPQRVADLDRNGLAFRPVRGLAAARDVHLLVRQRPAAPDHVLHFARLIRQQAAQLA
jgi:DNA-binding transcriptional LysR family regulator